MEAAAEHDHVRALGDLLGQLDRGLGDLGAGVGEEEGVDRPRGQLGETCRQWLQQIVPVGSVAMAATALGIPIGTLMSRLGRARAALRAIEDGGTTSTQAGEAPTARHLRIVGGSDDKPR